MGGKEGTRGPGSLGTATNSPVIDADTSPRTQNRPRVPQGKQERDWFKEDVYYPVGAQGYKLIRKTIGYAFGDKQGRELLALWLSGKAADEVTLDSEDWGDYMRAEPDLQKQIYKKLESDAYAMRERLNQSSGRLEGAYECSFHGEVSKKSISGNQIDGGYLTGYQILHGSKKTDTLRDVEITGQFTAVWSGGVSIRARSRMKSCISCGTTLSTSTCTIRPIASLRITPIGKTGTRPTPPPRITRYTSNGKPRNPSSSR